MLTAFFLIVTLYGNNLTFEFKSDIQMGKNSHLENTISIELSDSISSLNQIDEFEYLDEEEVNEESFKLIK